MGADRRGGCGPVGCRKHPTSKSARTRGRSSRERWRRALAAKAHARDRIRSMLPASRSFSMPVQPGEEACSENVLRAPSSRQSSKAKPGPARSAPHGSHQILVRGERHLAGIREVVHRGAVDIPGENTRRQSVDTNVSEARDAAAPLRRDERGGHRSPAPARIVREDRRLASCLR